MAIQRHRYGRIIWLCGDSIMGGYALGTATPPVEHPLRALNSPRGMLSYLLDTNGVRDVTPRDGPQVIGGVPFGDTGVNAVYPERIVDLIGTMQVRAGDVLCFEDAGPHGADPDWYAAALASLLAPIAARRTLTAVLATTPSYPPAPAHSRWDLPATPGGPSMNWVLRRVAGRRWPYEGWPYDLVLAEWATEMDKTRTYMLSQWALDPFHPDGIHPNIWGQLLLCRLILDAALVSYQITNTKPLRALLKAVNADPAWRQSVAYGSPYITDAAIDDCVTRLMGVAT